LSNNEYGKLFYNIQIVYAIHDEQMISISLDSHIILINKVCLIVKNYIYFMFAQSVSLPDQHKKKEKTISFKTWHQST
jgi:hypothetical protein